MAPESIISGLMGEGDDVRGVGTVGCGWIFDLESKIRLATAVNDVYN